MTGWRLGWMLVPEDLRRPVDVLTGNFTICPPVLSQYAAIAAFTPESYAELDGHVARYATNRACCSTACRGSGIDRLAPADGAFYVYADIGHLTDDSYAWCLRLLDETGVATAPGHRLRHPARQRVRPALVRRQRRGDHRGPRPARRLAQRARPGRQRTGEHVDQVVDEALVRHPLPLARLDRPRPGCEGAGQEGDHQRDPLAGERHPDPVTQPPGQRLELGADHGAAQRRRRVADRRPPTSRRAAR